MVKVVGIDGWKGISVEYYNRLVRIHFLGKYSFHLHLHDSFLPQQVKFIDQSYPIQPLNNAARGIRVLMPASLTLARFGDSLIL